MASIRKEIRLSAHPDQVWDVVRDVGAVHTRFAPGFVVDVAMEEGARLVTFANGFVAREVIVDVDEDARRLAYSVRSERLTHHNASFQVLAEAEGSRLIWIADVLPDAAAVTIGQMMDQGMIAARAALDAASPAFSQTA
jgi:carbon monoxide dehydrogenase subunit G